MNLNLKDFKGNVYSQNGADGITEIFPVPFHMIFGARPVPRPFRKVCDHINLPGFVFLASLRCPVQLFKFGRFTVRTLSKGRSLSETASLLLNKEKLTQALKEE